MIKRLCAALSFLIIYPLCANDSSDLSEMREAQIDELLRQCAEIRKNAAALKKKIEKDREDLKKPIVLESDSYGFPEKFARRMFSMDFVFAATASIGLAHAVRAFCGKFF